ncbi:DUF488 family protein [Castellaniella sp.]|uniref:DUF488 domain-containing protein n=1 Tax=Castellaniella sp. TaxID=1955812 RepID=UPI003A92948D
MKSLEHWTGSMTTIYAIGHSTHPLPAFIALLQASKIERLVDIRTVPRSRTNPQFNRDTLPASLAPYGIDYEHLEALGGLRGKSKTVASDVNGFWENDSFHHYADYALTPDFHQGLEMLLARAGAQRCAIMCSEAVWWRCHRRIVSDYLIAREVSVWHIMGAGHVDKATLTQGAKVQQNGNVVYPPTESGMD